MTDSAITDVLNQVADWPVNNVAAAAITLGGGDDADGTGGEADVVTHGDMEHVFQLASVSKLITAYATLMAVEEGAFELDDKVPAELVPSFEEPPTVRELLSHASGIEFRKHRQMRPAHTRRIYSSAGYEVLASFIEQATEMSFAEYVQLGICKPLGIEITVEGSAGHGFSASASAVTTLTEEFLRPKLLAEQTVAEALTVQFPDLVGVVPGYGRQTPCPWGLGFEIHGEKNPHWLGENMPATVAGHFGQSGTFLWFAPEQGLAAVVLTDEPFGDWSKDRWPEFNAQLWEAMAN